MLINERLNHRSQRGTFRQLRTLPTLIDFASNDYLGLARSPTLKEALLRFWEKQDLRCGSTGSRLLTGNSSYVEQLEKEIAAFHGYEAGLLFNCGYMANLGLLSLLRGDNVRILYDSQVHASMREGIRASQSLAFPFRHNDLNHLESRLKAKPAHVIDFICVEALYSTDGTLAPLTALQTLAQNYNGYLIVDEAHSVGVWGEKGRGCVYAEKLNPLFAQVLTFGKALGVQGAIVLGKQTLKEALINFAAPFMYTTALPHYALAAIQASYSLFPNMDHERVALQHLIQFSKSTSQVISIPCPTPQKANALAKKLQQAGYDVRALLSPTVRQGEERLRLCLHAFNTLAELTVVGELLLA